LSIALAGVFNCMSDNYSDNELLLQRLRNNDLKAFEYLYRNSRNRLFVLALSILKDEYAARDLVQDFFIDLWYFRIFETVTTSLNAYLFQSVRNRAYNYREKLQTQEKLKQGYITPGQDMMRYPLENEELGELINRAIDRLPTMAGKVFRMQYIDKLSHVEIAEKLGISKHTVSNHIARALKELRASLKKSL
jgi:RNA polymerase sigma-70 factor (family 1)